MGAPVSLSAVMSAVACRQPSIASCLFKRYDSPSSRVPCLAIVFVSPGLLHNNQARPQRHTLHTAASMISAAWDVDRTAVRCFFFRSATLWTLHAHCDTVDRANVASKILLFLHPGCTQPTPSAIVFSSGLAECVPHNICYWFTACATCKVFPCDQIHRQEHKNIQSTNLTLADKTLHFACKTLRCSNQKPLFCSHNSWPRNSQSLPARLLLLMKTWKTHRNV